MEPSINDNRIDCLDGAEVSEEPAEIQVHLDSAWLKAARGEQLLQTLHSRSPIPGKLFIAGGRTQVKQYQGCPEGGVSARPDALAGTLLC